MIVIAVWTTRCNGDVKEDVSGICAIFLLNNSEKID